MRFAPAIGLFMLCSLKPFAADGVVSFDHFAEKEGLSNNWVRSIYQDDDHFIWFGTADGLNRFDGYEFRTFRPVSSSNQSLGSIHINAVSKKNEQELWVCSDIGVLTFDLRNGKFSDFVLLNYLPVLCMLDNGDNTLWFGTGSGLYKYSLTDSSMVTFLNEKNDDSSISSNYINTLFRDSESNIWVGTKSGLNLLNQDNETFTRFEHSTKAGSISDNDVMSLIEDRWNRIWVGTAKNGLNLMQKTKKPGWEFKKITDGYIINMLIDCEDNLWICNGSECGLYRIPLDADTHRKRKPETEIFIHDPFDNSTLNDNSVFSIFEDRDKDIWIGTFNHGVNYLSKRQKAFHTIQVEPTHDNSIKSDLVNALFEDENYIWIGTEFGLDRYDKKRKLFRHFAHHIDDEHGLSANAVFSIYKDSRDNLWIGTWTGGLNRYDENTGHFTHYLPGDDPGSINDDKVFSILEDSRGNLWIGTIGGGLNRFDYQTESFIAYERDPSDSNSIFHNSINCIFETSGGILYISNYFALDQYNYERDNFTHHVYKTGTDDELSGKIISILEDSKKNIWLATSNGLVLFDEANNCFIPYMDQMGMQDYVIQSILEDSHGNLWAGTNNGILQFIDGVTKPVVPVVKNFTELDGLSGDKFSKRAAFLNAEGIMYFGTDKGVTWFHPDSIKLNLIPPPVVFTDLQLLNLNTGENKYESINKNINAMDKMELSHKKSNFIIYFAALNYLKPEKNEYQYILEGYDKDWINCGNRRSASYTNLNPGKYIFKVKGSNNDGCWNKTAKTIAIRIHPPWYGALFFRIFASLAMLSLMLLGHYIRTSFLRRQKVLLEEKVTERTDELMKVNEVLSTQRNQIIQQNEELQQHRNHLEELVEERTSDLAKAKLKAEESDRLKSSFLANISHEIRTPMNAIVGFSEVIKEKELNPKKREKYIDLIYENVQTLLALIDNILDISLIETNHLSIENASFDAKPLMLKLERIFRHKNTKEIKFEFVNKNDKEKLILFSDKIRLNQVFTNLLSNAFKYTDRGSIKMGYEQFKTHVRFFVSDTGIGIGPGETKKIFEQFIKIESNPNKLYRGTGIGLAISKNIVELMGGDIWVESTPGKGSVFYFTLPKFMTDSKFVKHRDPLRKIKLWLVNTTILSVEDEQSGFELLKIMLQPFGAQLRWINDRVQLLEYAYKHSANNTCIILMDINMSAFDSVEMARQIKMINDSIIVIAIVENSLRSEKRKLKEGGFNNFIVKPIKLEDILLIMARYTS
jgi:signal transduction histidine kinase/ligand-binding sensor domain-containing protein/CheY-like chemotaxis protein